MGGECLRILNLIPHRDSKTIARFKNEDAPEEIALQAFSRGSDEELPWIDSLPDGGQKDNLRRETELNIELQALKEKMKQEAPPPGESQDTR